jgi:lysophospholipase L1-like esterase
MRPFIFASVALALILIAACGGDDDNAAPDATTTPDATTVPSAPRAGITATPDSSDAAAELADIRDPLYIAIGDSLSYGAGASNRASTAFVPLVHAGLDSNVRLLNLGHSGDDSAEIRDHGHFQQALSLVEGRNNDDDAGNDVVLMTLEIGGNDLLDLFFDLVIPGICPNVEEGLKKPECVEAISAALEEFAPNLRAMLSDLREADPDLNLLLMTLYNPFSGSTVNAFEPIGELGLEGTPGTQFTEGVNDIIRAEGQAADATLVDTYPLFLGKAQDYIARDLIHPNDAGYRVMADAVLEEVD